MYSLKNMIVYEGRGVPIIMKKLLYLLLICVLCSAFAFTACSGGQETTEEVPEPDVSEMIIGSWIILERDGQPALTNEKGVITFVSDTEAYLGASFNALPDSTYWGENQKMDVAIDGKNVTLTREVADNVKIVNEIEIINISDTDTTGSMTVKKVEGDEESVIFEEDMHLGKIKEDYSKDILGTWEGRCTSEGSAFDDGRDHRWEYKDDGTYVYYDKDGDNWVPSDNTSSEYFVAGNLLCTRWTKNENEESREWWEISIDGNTMNWTATRKSDDDSTVVTTFEMTRVEE